MALSGRYRPFGRDAAYAQVAYGPGLGRYRGGVTTAPDPSGALEAAEASAYTVGYQHRWAPRWTTNVVWSAAELENDVGGSEVNERLVYAAANLVWWFLPERAWAGIELLHGDREVRSGASASADRIHLGVRFNLPGFDFGRHDTP